MSEQSITAQDEEFPPFDAFRSGATRYVVGDRVRSCRVLRQDGTFPDPAVRVGEVLIESGTPGQVVDVGVYLNEHIVYAVAFDSGRLVGCLERELDLIASEEVSIS